ncbi:MAG TPA: ATP-binding protein, partial [Streptosporangiaceae bacterium]
MDRAARSHLTSSHRSQQRPDLEKHAAKKSNPRITSGTGKSHLAEALAHAAIEKDLRVAWFTLETLTAAIGRAKADGSVARTVTRICRADLIVVDDIGMLPAGQDAAEAFYRITDAAYERRSVAVTSNIHPSGFDSIMPKTLATA